MIQVILFIQGLSVEETAVRMTLLVLVLLSQQERIALLPVKDVMVVPWLMLISLTTLKIQKEAMFVVQPVRLVTDQVVV